MSQYQEGKPVWILLKQETVNGSGISWAICKSAPHSRQITKPAPHRSVFYRPDALPASIWCYTNTFIIIIIIAFSAIACSASTLLVGRQEGRLVCKTTEWWGTGVVICLEQGADLHMAQLMPLLLTVSCNSKTQIGFTFLVPAHLGSDGKRAVNRVCVCVIEENVE